jgi:hypothetical protein
MKRRVVLFMAKLVIVAAAVLVLVALRRVVYGRRTGEPAVSTTSRALAAVSLVLWFLAIVTGRYMAYV